MSLKLSFKTLLPSPNFEEEKFKIYLLRELGENLCNCPKSLNP